MTIDYIHFTPWASLAGGALIGLAAVLLMAGLGRVMGCSGIAAAVITGPGRAWRLTFLAATAFAPVLYTLVYTAPTARIEVSPLVLAIGGVIVGVGTRMGAGCTSGHGICGLARLSPRSMVAVITFMVVAIAVASLNTLISGEVSL